MVSLGNAQHDAFGGGIGEALRDGKRLFREGPPPFFCILLFGHAGPISPNFPRWSNALDLPIVPRREEPADGGALPVELLPQGVRFTGKRSAPLA